MPWKVIIHRKGFEQPQVHSYADAEELELAQAVIWWARYTEPGDRVEILKGVSESGLESEGDGVEPPGKAIQNRPGNRG